MIVSPWQSTVLKQHKLNTLLSELALAYSSNDLAVSDTGVTFVTPRASKVPPFVLPVTEIEYDRRRITHRPRGVVMDARSFSRHDRTSETGFIIANQMQADFWFRLGTLTAMWVRDPAIRLDYMRVSDLPAQTYIRWISQVLIGKLGLDMELGRDVQIVTATMYVHLFHSADEIMDEQGKAKTARLIQRWTRYPLDLIQGIVADLPYMSSIQDYVDGLHGYFQGNTRIQQINAGLLVMGTAHAWFGYGAREMSAVAIEYPPVFLSLVEAACNSKVWKKTFLGKIVDKLDTGRAAEGFVRSMEVLMQTASTEAYYAEQLGFAEGGDTYSAEAAGKMLTGGGVTASEIKTAEKQLGVYFSGEYKRFLQTHGYASIGDREVCGLGVEGHLNVVDVTERERDSLKLKPGRYILENSGMDSRFYVSDAVGRVYIASPTGETDTGLRFDGWFKALQREAKVSLECYTRPWGEAEYKDGLTMVETVHWWGGRPVEVETIALTDEGEEPTPEQINAYRDFTAQIATHIDNTRQAVSKYIHETFPGQSIDPFQTFTPIKVVFDRHEGDWTIVFDEVAQGMIIYSKSGFIAVDHSE